MPPIFPASDLDSAKALLSAVGGFWANTYSGNFLVESMLYARGRLEAQAHLELLELIAAMSRFKVPVFHTDNWYLLLLKESERNLTEANFARFDGTYTFNDGLVFDEPVSTPFHVWTAPSDLVDVKVIMNRISEATVTLHQGLDFVLKDRAIWFKDNPFTDERISKRDIIVGTEIVDRECAIWLYRGQWDWDTIYQQFGYAIDIQLQSSENYRSLVNAVYDGLVEGTTVRCIEDAFSAICDVPLAKGSEVVEDIFTDAYGLVVATTDNVYRFKTDSNVLVRIGDILFPGQAITDNLQFFEFNRGQVPDEIRALALGRGFLAHGFFQDLVFENKTVDLVVEEDVDGYTKISFEVGGFPTDIEKFWDDVHTKGIAQNNTFAMLLDQRTNKTGQPTALALPRTINPLGFLLQNIFRNNLFVVSIRAASQGPNALGLENARILRNLVPPHTAGIIVVQLEIRGDEIIMDGPGDDTTPGYEESVKIFAGKTLTDEVDAEVMIEESVRIFQITGICH